MVSTLSTQPLSSINVSIFDGYTESINVGSLGSKLWDKNAPHMTAVALERREGVWGSCGNRKGRETGSFKEAHEREGILSTWDMEDSLKTYLFVIQSPQLVWATFAAVLPAEDQALILCWLWVRVMVFFWNDSWELQTMYFFQTFHLQNNDQHPEGSASWCIHAAPLHPETISFHTSSAERWTAYRKHSHHYSLWNGHLILSLIHMSEFKNTKSVLLVLNVTYTLVENIYSVSLCAKLHVACISMF